MRISTKGVCAVEMMLDILEYGQELPITMKEVALRKDISNKYAEQIVSILSSAGLVTSIRGPKGGYRATEKGREATVGTILRLTESVLKDQSQQQENNGLSSVLQELDGAIDEILDKYTLKQVLELKQDVGYDYII